MAWGRGFFRAWVAFSVLWVAVVSLIYYGHFKSPYLTMGGYAVSATDKPAIFFAPGSDSYWNAQQNASKNLLKKREVNIQDTPDTIPFFTDNSVSDDQFYKLIESHVDEVYRRTQEQKKVKSIANAIEGVEVAFGVPLGLLIAGFSIRWILLGFRNPAQPA